ncbi:MAG: DUF5654 family protein [Patescibacteria group bacterium]
MGKIKPNDKLHTALTKQILALATGGFGLAAALAWNDTIKLLIDQNIKKRFPEDGGVSYQVLYAVIITLLAVVITYFLTRLVQKKSP